MLARSKLAIAAALAPAARSVNVETSRMNLSFAYRGWS